MRRVMIEQSIDDVSSIDANDLLFRIHVGEVGKGLTDQQRRTLIGQWSAVRNVYGIRRDGASVFASVLRSGRHHQEAATGGPRLADVKRRHRIYPIRTLMNGRISKLIVRAGPPLVGWGFGNRNGDAAFGEAPQTSNFSATQGARRHQQHGLTHADLSFLIRAPP